MTGADVVRLRRTWLVAGLLLLAAGCAHAPPAPCEPGIPLHLTLHASERLNPDSLGRSLPTDVRVLQLRSPARLEAAEPNALWDEPAAVLAQDLVAQEDLTVDPGTPLTRWLALQSGARYVAVVGRFRQPVGSGWRDWAEVAPGDDRCPAAGAPARQGPPTTRDLQLAFELEGSAIQARMPAARGATAAHTPSGR